MLKLLTRANEEDLRNYELLLDALGLTCTDGWQNALSDRFADYNNKEPFNTPLLETPPDMMVDAENYKRLFKTTRKFARDLKKKIYQISPSLCPYCGRTGPNTIDHILQKDKFAEFSLYTPNLIPCCSNCNSCKNSIYWHQGQPCIVNLYHDRFLENKCIHVKVLPDKALGFNVPAFEYEFSWEDSRPREVELLKEHFKRFKLEELLAQQFQDELHRYHGIFSKSADNDSNPTTFVREMLRHEYETEKSRYGFHCHRCLIIDAILIDNNLITFLCTPRNLLHEALPRS